KRSAIIQRNDFAVNSLTSVPPGNRVGGWFSGEFRHDVVTLVAREFGRIHLARLAYAAQRQAAAAFHPRSRVLYPPLRAHARKAGRPLPSLGLPYAGPPRP